MERVNCEIRCTFQQKNGNEVYTYPLMHEVHKYKLSQKACLTVSNKFYRAPYQNAKFSTHDPDRHVDEHLDMTCLINSKTGHKIELTCV